MTANGRNADAGEGNSAPGSASGSEADATFISDEWPEQIADPARGTMDLDTGDEHLLMDRHPTPVDPHSAEHEDNTDKTIESSEISEDNLRTMADSEVLDEEGFADQTMMSDEGDFELSAPIAGGETIAIDPDLPRDDDGDDAGATFVLDQPDESMDVDVSGVTIASDAGDSYDQTVMSDDPDASGATMLSGIDVSDEDMRTIATNYDASEASANPMMTIKSRVDNTSDDGSLRGEDVESVPRRSMSGQGELSRPGQVPEYELIKVLGEGGMGVVWSARQTSVDRHVAVKMIKGAFASKASQRQKFLAEAVVTGDLDHPNIVPIYDVGKDSVGTLFYSMKQVKGTPWQKVIKSKSVNENLEILLRTCDAMAFAHARGIVHRDLKPENIMLGEFGEVLVMDWGLALYKGDPEKASRLRQSTSMGGTPAYMAPEMATGPIERITPASDIYLLGAILWEIITGRPPHPGKKVQECLLAAMRNTIRETDKSGELIDIARKALSTNPADRHERVQDLQDAIRSYLAHSESLAMAARAEQDLQQAKATDNYRDYAKAVFAFEEAVALWSGNETARSGTKTSRLAYAEAAHRKGDYDLATSLLDPQDQSHQPLLEQVSAAIAERATRQRRLKLARRAMVGMATMIFTIVTIAFFWIRSERNEAITQRGIAEERAVALKKQTDIAVEQTEIAKQNEAEALRQKGIAETNFSEAVRQKGIAELKTMEAQESEKKAIKNETLARKNEQEALRQKQLADEQRQKADEQRQLAQYEAYVSGIGLAAAKIQENAFDVALQLLEDSPVELRNWEWGRLRHLCSQALLSIPAQKTVDAIAMSPDDDRFVMATWNRKALIVNRATGKTLHELPQQAQYVHCADWSPLGHLVATGGSDREGFIRLWDADSGKELLRTNGHTDAVIGLRFSPDGRWLISTSYDNTARLWQLSGTSSAPQLTTVAVLDQHSWWVWGGAFTPGFDPFNPAIVSRIVTVSQDGKAIVWRISADTAAGPAPVANSNSSEQSIVATQEAVFSGHGNPVYSVDISPQNGAIVTSGYDNRVLMWRTEDVPSATLDDLLSRRQPEMNLVEMRGHTGPVQSVRFSRDGSRIVSGGRDNAVIIWNAETGQRIRTLRGHYRAVRSAQFSNDNQYVVSGGQDEQALVWSLAAYAETRELRDPVLADHRDAVLSARFSPDGQRIVTAGRDRVAMLWDAATGKRLEVFREGHEFLATSAQVIPRTQLLVTAAADNSVRLWDIDSGTQVYQIPVETGRSAVLAVSPLGTWLVTGKVPPAAVGQSGPAESAQAWQIRDLVMAAGDAGSAMPSSRELQGHNGQVTTANFHPQDDNLVVTGDSSGRCILRNLQTGQVIWNVRHHTERILQAVFLPSGTHILTSSQDHTVAMLDARTGAEIRTLKVGVTPTNLAVAPDGKTAITVNAVPQMVATQSARITVWDLTTGQPLRQFDLGQFGISTLEFTTSSDLVIMSCTDNTVRLLRLNNAETPVGETLFDFQKLGGIVWHAGFVRNGTALLTVGGNEARLWDATTRRLLQSFSPHGAVASASFSSNGSRIVTGSWDNTIKVWDVETSAAILKLEGQHKGYVNSVVYSPEGDTILSASDDGTAVLWDSMTGEFIRRFEGHTSRVRSAAFSPDGTLILTASNDRTAKLWERATGKLVRTLTGHQQAVLCAVFSSDGQLVATGGEDSTARLWDAQTGNELETLQGHIASVTGVVFSPDNKRLFTASQDKTAKVWDATPEHRGKEILTLAEHQEEVTAITLNHSGDTVLTASRDSRAILWLTSPWKAPAPEKE